MKTLIRGILTLVLICTFTLIPTVIYAEKTMNDELIGKYLKQEITLLLTESMVDNLENLSPENYNEIQEIMTNNEEINAFVEKYSNRIIGDLSNEELEEIDLETDLKTLLRSNKEQLEEVFGQTFTDEELEEAIDNTLAEEDATDAYQQIIQEAKKEMPEETKTLIDSYNTLTSTQFIVITTITSILSMIIIALLKRPYYKVLINVAIAGIISALLVAIIGGSIAFITNILLGTIGGMDGVSATPTLIISGIMILVSVLLIVIVNILDKKGQRNNAIS